MRGLKIALAGLAVLLSVAATAESANRISLDWPAVGNCGHATISIRIENDVDISRISLPLNLRSLTGAQRYGDVTLTGPLGRGVGKLTGLQLLDVGEPPFATNDPIVITYESFSLGSDCLPAGALETIFQLTIPVRNNGDMIVDTMYSPPCSRVELLRCSDGQPIVLDEFSPGMITVVPTGAPITSVDNNPLIGYAGKTLQNQIFANDPEGDPLRFGIQQGPGTVDSLTGLWTWETCDRDTGTYQVRYYARDVEFECGAWPTNLFTVTVLPRILGDLNCDGKSDAIDLNLLIDHMFFNIPLVPCE